MRTRFLGRSEAGQLLAKELERYVNHPDVLVLALPRGGVPVAAEVARHLHVPLDVFVVRKLGLPGHEELAMGAIARGGVRIINQDVVGPLGISKDIIDAVATREHRELLRREQAYRDDLPDPDVKGKTVILVDDGIATGSTMLAAVAALRKLEVGHIVVATPTVAPTTLTEIERVADEMVAVMTPEPFFGVGRWYDDFSQTTDEEVCAILKRCNAQLYRSSV